MASVYSNPKTTEHLPKSNFPMIQEIDFSSLAGTLVPVFCDFMHPGDRYSGHAEMITRTNELQTAAFADIDEYIEYFFVPAQKLNMIFGEWFFNIDDRNTVWRPAELPERASVLPNVTVAKLKSYAAEETVQNSFELHRTHSLVRMLQHYRYDVYRMFDKDGKAYAYNDAWWNVPLPPFQAYQAIYYDYYRDSLWQQNDVEAYNTDDWLTSLTSDNITSARLAKIFQLHQRRQNSDYFTGSHPSPLQNATGMLNINGVREQALMNINQWLDNAGISFKLTASNPSLLGSNSRINVAMDSKINIDSLEGKSIVSDGSITGDLFDDNFNTLAISSNGDLKLGQSASGGSISALDAEVEVDGADVYPLGTSQQRLFYQSGLGIYSSELNSDVSESAGTRITITDTQLANALNGLKSSITSTSIRTMFALEKLARITGRAGKHYDDQVLAHYGFKVPKGYSNEVQMIGQQHSQIHIGEIISPTTVPDGGSVAGEIVGKGYGTMQGDKAIDFTAPCHGYLMAIYSAVPRRVSTPCGNPREYSQLYRIDFATPELMNLGQQPLFFSEFNLMPSPDFNPVASWNWRYMEDKCRISMAIGALSRFDFVNQSNNGVLSDWTIQYPILNTDPNDPAPYYLSYQNFQCSTQAFNSIMLLQYDNEKARLNPYSPGDESADGKVARLFDRDPLFHKLTMKLYKDSFMSTFGEPRID